MESKITKEEYQEKIIEMVANIENVKILRYIFIIIRDIVDGN